MSFSGIARPGKLAMHNLVYWLLYYKMTVLLEYMDLLQARWQGTASIREGLGPIKPTFGYAINVIDITT